ncbi:hypothetical protein CVT26_013745 [Gymnopilus dilepis]|uniref:Uncharacterized protein n=1 Tax=Gymnopilus dilepis TaxID=231916 RepID=A0A409YWR5_9AGAR|nr:hypothetical protein CVT26_013745 [Gymnopilus dilepis]
MTTTKGLVFSLTLNQPAAHGQHPVAPCILLNVPAAHLAQFTDPAAEYQPGEQACGLARELLGHWWPAGHDVQDELPGVEEYDPEGHGVSLVAPAVGT